MSELEGVVLGIVQTSQPCTAYRVRMALQESPSAVWSGSAGAIYPLLKRLEEAHMVEARGDSEDRRGRRLLRVTSIGRRALREWMLAASSKEVAGAVSDTVRSRTFFLGALKQKDRQRFVDEAITALEAYLETTREDLEHRATGGDPHSYLAALGGVYQAEARVKWMKEVRTRLSQGET